MIFETDWTDRRAVGLGVVMPNAGEQPQPVLAEHLANAVGRVAPLKQSCCDVDELGWIVEAPQMVIRVRRIWNFHIGRFPCDELIHSNQLRGCAIQKSVPIAT